MKKALKALAATLVLLSILPAAVSPCYGQSKLDKVDFTYHDKVVSIVEKLSFKDFPTTVDVLTVIMIESMFDIKARNGISKGLMQVNHGPFEINANIEAGIRILRDYYKTLGSATAALMAYNIGIGSYLKGKRAPAYIAKYRRHRGLVSKAYSERIMARSDDASVSDDLWNFPALKLPGSPGGLLVCFSESSYNNPICGWDDKEDNQ